MAKLYFKYGAMGSSKSAQAQVFAPQELIFESFEKIQSDRRILFRKQ